MQTQVAEATAHCEAAIKKEADSQRVISELRVELEKSRHAHVAEVGMLKKERDELKSELLGEQASFGHLSWSTFKADPIRSAKHISGLTSCRTVKIFEALYDILNLKGAFENVRVRDKGLEYQSTKIRQEARKLLPRDMLFLTLMRLRSGMTQDDLAFLFGVSDSVISRTFESGLLHMYHCLNVLFKPPTLKMMAKTCPKQFRARFGGSGGYIIDCSDIECQVGSDPQVQYATYSDYHHFCGAKFLAAYSFCGAYCWGSHAYNSRFSYTLTPCTASSRRCALSCWRRVHVLHPRMSFSHRASDNAVTELSGFLDILESGMTVLADRGFTIFYLLGKIGVTLYIPPFRKKNDKESMDEKQDGYAMTTEDSKLTHKIANLRIHVERGFERTKKFKIFDRPIPMTMLDLATPMFHVCSMLTNMQLPLVANMESNSYTGTLVSVK